MDLASVALVPFGKLTSFIDRAESRAFKSPFAVLNYVEVGHESMGHDDKALEVFVARILKHPIYADRLRAMVEPAFAELVRGIGSSRGTVLERSALEAMLASAIAKGATAEPGITLAVHNWMSEAGSPLPDYVVDWTAHFDRSTRRVPHSQMWRDTLIPQLVGMRNEIAAKREEKLIRLRGKCALSTAILVGATFPTVGGWIIEMAQPPSKGLWRSDATPVNPYALTIETVDGDPNGSDLVLALNIKGDGRDDVIRFVNESGPSPKMYLFISSSDLGGQAISGDAEACAFAGKTVENLGALLKKQNIRMTRLFYYGPQALAVFLGQRLTSVGKVQLFEYQDPSYAPSCLIQT